MNQVSKALLVVDRINEWAGKAVSYLVAALIAIVTYEVVARYAFNAPTIWAIELSCFVFAGMWLFAGGYALRYDAHVKVDLLYSRFSPRGKAILDVITAPVFFIMVAAIIWITWKYALISIDRHELSFSLWAPRIYIVKTLIPIGASLVLIQGIARLIRNIYLVTKGTNLS